MCNSLADQVDLKTSPQKACQVAHAWEKHLAHFGTGSGPQGFVLGPTETFSNAASPSSFEPRPKETEAEEHTQWEELALAVPVLSEVIDSKSVRAAR